jgi:hypothetical protein
MRYFDSDEQATASKALETLEELKKVARGDRYRSFIKNKPDRINLDLLTNSVGSVLYPIATGYFGYGLFSEIKRLERLKQADEKVRRAALRLGKSPKIKLAIATLLALISSLISANMLRIDIELKKKQLDKQKKQSKNQTKKLGDSMYRFRRRLILDEINELKELKKLLEEAKNISANVPYNGRIITIRPIYDKLIKAVSAVKSGNGQELDKAINEAIKECTPTIARQNGLAVGAKAEENLLKIGALKGKLEVLNSKIIAKRRIAATGTDKTQGVRGKIFPNRTTPTITTATAGQAEAIRSAQQIEHSIKPFIRTDKIKDKEIAKKLIKAVAEEKPERAKNLALEIYQSVKTIGDTLTPAVKINIKYGDRLANVKNAVISILRFLKI